MPALSDLLLPKIAFKVERGMLDEVRRRTLQTCRQLGVIRADGMDESKFFAGRFELLTALAYPDADLDALTLCNDFNTYLFFVDDRAEEDENYGKKPELLHRYFEDHLRLLREGSAVAGDDPAGRLLLSIRSRLLRRASRAWLTRFAGDVEDYLLWGTVGGARHWSAGTVPTPAEYLARRGADSAAMCVQDLIEVAGAGELPGRVHEQAELRQLRRLCTNVLAFTNDLVSFPKEVRRQQSPNNLVHVLITHEQRSLESALERVVEIVNDDLLAFERIAAGRRPFAGETEVRVQRYLHSQRAWMAGNLLWSLASGRYADPDSPFPELRASPSARAAYSGTLAAGAP